MSVWDKLNGRQVVSIEELHDIWYNSKFINISFESYVRYAAEELTVIVGDCNHPEGSHREIYQNNRKNNARGVNWSV